MDRATDDCPLLIVLHSDGVEGAGDIGLLWEPMFAAILGREDGAAIPDGPGSGGGVGDDIVESRVGGLVGEAW